MKVSIYLKERIFLAITLFDYGKCVFFYSQTKLAVVMLIWFPFPLLIQIANSMVSTWTGPPAMKSLFTRMFCCKTCPNIVKTNNFMNFQSYFLQKVKFIFLNECFKRIVKNTKMFLQLTVTGMFVAQTWFPL